MSQLKVNTIRHTSSTSDNIALAADGSVTLPSDTVDIATLSATGTASSSTFLRGDNAWAATTPAWESFQAEMVGDQTQGTSAWNAVKFNAQNWDTNDNYLHTDGNWYYTAPAAGKYWYKASLKLADLGENKRLEVALYKNTSGSWVQQVKTWRWAFNPQGSNGSVSVETTGLIQLAASDKIRVYVHHNHGSDRDLDDNWCLFEMFKLDGE